MSVPLCVLLVINNLDCGGAQRLLVDYCRCHDRDKFKLTVAAFGGGSLRRELDDLQIPVFILNRHGRFDVSLIWQLSRIIREQRIGLVHCSLFAARFWGRLAAVMNKVPVIVTQHAFPPRLEKQPYRIIERTLAGKTERFLTDSDTVRRQMMTRYRIPCDRIKTLYPAVDDRRIKPLLAPAAARLTIGLGQEHYLGLFVGRLEYQKGLDILLSAITPEHCRQGFRLIVKGNGSLKNELLAACVSRGLDGIIVFIQGELDLGSLLHAADCLLLPSRWEGMPLALLEAAKTGLPIIASDIDNFREARVFYENIHLVSNSPAGWRRAMTDLANGIWHRRGLPLNGFGVDERSRCLERLYEEAVNEHADH